ncbi:MAG: glycoside hydrolase family 2 protein [Bacteroidia bacterium]|nr:glycoside hydrolase family 2 protein [Bacteroidia bacterium]MCF8427932.1 glycoside hydrolase family 2 protein [Bacteroidia bacterium]
MNFLWAQTKSINLQKNDWQFRKAGDEEWKKARVPGNVHQDLMAISALPNPFLGNNEKLVQWIENEDWEYQCYFEVDSEAFSFSNISLKLKNLDTYAKIFLNGKLLAETENQFRTHTFDAKSFLKIGENHIRIHFESAVKKGKELAKKLPYTLPGGEAVFTRKAPYQYGWDWGPRLVTCGIGEIELECWNNLKIESISQVQNFLADSSVYIQFKIKVHSEQKCIVYLLLLCPELGENQNRLLNLNLSKGENLVQTEIHIKQPKLWWTNGLGEAYLHHFKFLLTYQQKILDQTELAIGIRKLNLVQTNDKFGRSFYFELNGKPVFMKGANYIPPHNFLNHLDKSIYSDLVQKAKEANMNMLRVWGGGVYVPDAFYKACDEQGILVWQDFMFAGGLYPGDSAFLNNVKEEIKDQIIRLRNHACLAIWCGNNEIDESWKNWGYQKQYRYTTSDSTEIAENYKKLFLEIIPKEIALLDPKRPYHPSSPEIGWGHEESLKQGDSHYWGVWWGMEPFEKYEEKVGRFMSEYGFQGMPDYKTFEKFMTNFSNEFDSASYKNHQKHPTGYQTISTYAARDFPEPKNFREQIYISQLTQARGMRIAMEAHRRNMPYCMGTLLWQLNDCWPVISWSAIDFYGNEKAVYFEIKHAFNPLLLSFKEEQDTLYLYLVSDKQEALTGELKLQIIQFDGQIKFQTKLAKQIAANSSSIIYKLAKTELSKLGINPNKIVVNASFSSQENLVRTNYYLVKPKELLLETPKISIKKVGQDKFEISSNTLVKDLFIYEQKSEQVMLSENYFDLLPNETKTIEIIWINSNNLPFSIEDIYFINLNQLHVRTNK